MNLSRICAIITCIVLIFMSTAGVLGAIDTYQIKWIWSGNYVPPASTGLSGTSWAEGVHWTWSAGSGHVTDSYNVSYNSTWFNGSSNAYYNHTTGCGQTSNIIIWAYNTTGDGSLSVSSISDSKNALACPGVIAPVITDWYNNYTSDNSTSFTIPTTDNRTVFFNVTANQSITNWIWYVDGTVYQNTDVNNITYTWTLGGEKTVLVYGINGNGQTQTLTWSITIDYTEYELSYLTLLDSQKRTIAEETKSLSIILSILIIIGIILFVLGFLVPNSILTFLGSMTFIISTLLPIPIFTNYPYFGIALTGILLMLGLISLIVTFYQWFTTYNAGKGYHRWDNDFDEL